MHVVSKSQVAVCNVRQTWARGVLRCEGWCKNEVKSVGFFVHSRRINEQF